MALEERCRRSTVISVFLSALSIIFVVCSVSTEWLNTKEENLFVESADEICQNFTISDCIGLPQTRFSIGFWRFCMRPSEDSLVSCCKLDDEVIIGRVNSNESIGFEEEWTCSSLNFLEFTVGNSESKMWRSTAIAEAQCLSEPIFLLALLLTSIGGIFTAIGCVKQNGKLLYGAVLNTFTGVTILSALVVYVTNVNDEIRYTKVILKDGTFEYTYGWAAYMMCLAYAFSLLSAVSLLKDYFREEFASKFFNELKEENTADERDTCLFQESVIF